MKDSQATNTYGNSRGDSTPLGLDLYVAPDYIGRYRVERVIGEGGFGTVLLAQDEQLHRQVAIKVPHLHIVKRAGSASLYLAEARAVARLDHPHIVPVHDVGETEEYPCYIVSKYIDGTDLAHKLRETRFSFQAAAELVATIAEALHHAHSLGLVHRDIKPANILLDKEGRPHIADFGLALREQEVGTGARRPGTPAYMSPEQARGEGHRVDGRSDIFSLGVVFYQLLTGQRPFRAETEPELIQLVIRAEPRPPRQIDERIPKELERICLKAMAKRAADRYATAKEFAEDLRHMLAKMRVGDELPTVSAAPPAPITAPTPVTDPSARGPVRIVPKGLRSFDSHDADFFLELLPGPRDREGLPESLRFWKVRIEETDADQTFTVGLMYGPSGCGKSSLVKAGLIPLLGEHVITILVEATAQETESRLLAGLHKRFVDLPEHAGLGRMMSLLRRGQGALPGQKVLIVIDQFEQWLHARSERGDELVEALRHCDGARVQCLLLVRDDFWLAVSRFMRDLEIDLVPGRNIALVDLFDLDHARRVLAGFGRALGKLPNNPAEMTREQKQFLDRAVVELASEGKVICVRLALFAEMMKSRPWTTAILREVGGAKGLGVAFLEETFSAPAANPTHRLHQQAARAVLQTLLPENGGAIKGKMRSRGELLAASGYADRPRDFMELIRILDGETRLITPTEPEGAEATPNPTTSGPYYQLSHDYLVGPLRDWLTLKQRETWHGRAELMLAERATQWAERPRARHLPSLAEWIRIRLLTRSRQRTPIQRRMLHAADTYYLTRGVLATLLLTVVLWGAGEYTTRMKANALLDQLRSANIAEVPPLLTELEPLHRRIQPRLERAIAQESEPARKLPLALALVRWNADQVPFLHHQLLTARPQDFAVIRQALEPHRQEMTLKLWGELADSQQPRARRFRAAAALAMYAPDDARWPSYAPFLIEALVAEGLLALPHWLNVLQPLRGPLLPAIATALEEERTARAEWPVLIGIYRDLAAGDENALNLLEQRFTQSGPKEPAAQARLVAALAALGRVERAWPLLQRSADPTLRSYLIERLADSGIDPLVLDQELRQQPSVSIRRALLLVLGSLPSNRLNDIPARLAKLYKDDPDAGIHSASRWALRQWKQRETVERIDLSLATGQVQATRQWYVTRELRPPMTFSIIDGPGELMPRAQKMAHRFAIAATEVTVKQMAALVPEHRNHRAYVLSDDCPANSVNWYQAARFCNKLSQLEGIPLDQWCYREVDGKMELVADYAKRTGYRLPTAQEWRYACRAGATTPWNFGHANRDLASQYASWLHNAFHGQAARPFPVASFKPNEWGLFDMHGSMEEWCQEPPEPTPELDQLRTTGALGGSAASLLEQLRCDRSPNIFLRTFTNPLWGFRVARTLPQ